MKIYTGTTERVLAWGTEKIMFDVEMDLRVLNAMARKAASNKTMKSTDGALTVHVIGTVGEVTPQAAMKGSEKTEPRKKKEKYDSKDYLDLANTIMKGNK